MVAAGRRWSARRQERGRILRDEPIGVEDDGLGAVYFSEPLSFRSPHALETGKVRRTWPTEEKLPAAQPEPSSLARTRSPVQSSSASTKPPAWCAILGRRRVRIRAGPSARTIGNDDPCGKDDGAKLPMAGATSPAWTTGNGTPGGQGHDSNPPRRARVVFFFGNS